jgi:hypothetical protein
MISVTGETPMNSDTPPAQTFIYVLTVGEYSTMRIIGVYTEAEIAEEMAEHCGGDIEVILLNAARDLWLTGVRPYEVVLHEDGTLFRVTPSEPEPPNDEPFWDHPVSTMGWDGAGNSLYSFSAYEYYVWASSEDTAVQMAQARLLEKKGDH